MKKRFILSIGVLAAGMLPGCGSGGGSPVYTPSLLGSWTRAAIGGTGQSESALVACPGSITLGGEAVSCAATDKLSFGSDTTVALDLSDNAGRPTRIRGNYKTAEGRVDVTVFDQVTDYDRNGQYTPEETTFPVADTLSLSVAQLSFEELVVETTLNGVTHRARYVRTP